MSVLESLQRTPERNTSLGTESVFSQEQQSLLLPLSCLEAELVLVLLSVMNSAGRGVSSAGPASAFAEAQAHPLNVFVL